MYALQTFTARCLCILFFLNACSSIDLKSKLEYSAELPKWTQLYVSIQSFGMKVRNTHQHLINKNHELTKLHQGMVDSVQVERTKYSLASYGLWIKQFETIKKDYEQLREKYKKDRILFNHWLSTVQSDVISEEKAKEEIVLFQKKYQSLKKQLDATYRKYDDFVLLYNSKITDLEEMFPSIVGLRIRD